MKDHAYSLFANQKDTSEWYHLQQLTHFQSKFSWEVFKKTDAEKAELKNRMYNYPNKNHCPIPPNS